MANIALQDGKVVTKDGKVSCACCGGQCGCYTTSISEPLLSILRSATGGTCNGQAPVDWNASGGGFFGIWYVSGSIYTASMSAVNNCFEMGGDNAKNVISSGQITTECPCPYSGFGMTCENSGDFTINGVAFPSFNGVLSGPLVNPPSFVFS